MSVSWSVHQEGGGWISFPAGLVAYVEKELQSGKESCDFTVQIPGIPLKSRVFFREMCLLDLRKALARKLRRSTSSTGSGEIDPRDVQRVTQWNVVPLNDISTDDSCSICISEFHGDDDMEEDDCIVHLSQCGPHYFHQNCIIRCFYGPGEHDRISTGHLKCPVCSSLYGTRTGTMPFGFMSVQYVPKPLPGFESVKSTIHIRYSMPAGIQGPEHPFPGQLYSGTIRNCFLPDTEEGKAVLEKLKIAFDRRLTFVVGNSITSGKQNTVVWNGIHHKTSVHGGPACYGYPDPTYLNRVSQELASVGIL